VNERKPLPLTAEQAGRLGQAFRLLQQGAAAEAMAIAVSVARQTPRSSDVEHLLALCHKAAGEQVEAEKAFRRASELAPANPHILGNYANFLKHLGRTDEALQFYRRAVQAHPAFLQGWINLGLGALDTGRISEAKDSFERAIDIDAASSSAWQGLGNAHRADGDLERAEGAFRRAVALAPEKGAAWVNLSVVVKLSGRPAEALPFVEKARNAGFTGPELADAESGALIDLGEVEAAFRVAHGLTESAPHYVAGHVTRANLLWEYGDLLAPGEDPAGALREAANNQPGNGLLQLALIRFLVNAGRSEEAVRRVRRLRAIKDAPALALIEAGALEALEQTKEAGALYAHEYEVTGIREAPFLAAYARHLLRAGQWDAAAARAMEATETDPDNQEGLSYLGTAWRLLGDPREHWLCDYDRTVALVEVEPPDTFADQAEFLSALAATLDRLHKACREPVNQSLRGGSQTPGRLFGRPDPVISATHAAITRAVEVHIATLPDDSGHPFFRRKKRSVSFTGSWSVKLWSSGRHVNHFHPQGWMSSAYYVSLPRSVTAPGRDTGRPGWIQFGQPPEDLDLNLPPRRFVQPKAGHVALFPSYMWHGTVPFEDAEPRITVAFDMLPVR